jgi:hypothetical protein
MPEANLPYNGGHLQYTRGLLPCSMLHFFLGGAGIMSRDFNMAMHTFTISKDTFTMSRQTFNISRGTVIISWAACIMVKDTCIASWKTLAVYQYSGGYLPCVWDNYPV